MMFQEGLPCINRKQSAESPFDRAINSAALSLFLNCTARNIASRDSFYVICQRMRLPFMGVCDY